MRSREGGEEEGGEEGEACLRMKRKKNIKMQWIKSEDKRVTKQITRLIKDRVNDITSMSCDFKTWQKFRDESEVGHGYRLLNFEIS